jgi:hypothetical protein
MAGVMRLIDYLPSRIFELVVHTGDIGGATGMTTQTDPAPAVIALVLAAVIAAERDDFLDPLLALTGRGVLPPGYSVI